MSPRARSVTAVVLAVTGVSGVEIGEDGHPGSRRFIQSAFVEALAGGADAELAPRTAQLAFLVLRQPRVDGVTSRNLGHNTVSA